MNTPATVRTHVKAFTQMEERFRGWRSSTVDGDNEHEAIAEIRRVDMVDPPRPQEYLCFHVAKYLPGRPDHDAYWLDAMGRRIDNPPAQWRA